MSAIIWVKRIGDATPKIEARRAMIGRHSKEPLQVHIDPMRRHAILADRVSVYVLQCAIRRPRPSADQTRIRREATDSRENCGIIAYKRLMITGGVICSQLDHYIRRPRQRLPFKRGVHFRSVDSKRRTHSQLRIERMRKEEGIAVLLYQGIVPYTDAIADNQQPRRNAG